MPSPSPPPPPAATPEAPTPTSRSLEDCLELLRGPTDERRLVGLLLATRVLPKGDAAALSAAREAIGDAFLARLLLPLDDGVGPGAQKNSDSFQVRILRLKEGGGQGGKRGPKKRNSGDWLDFLKRLIFVPRPSFFFKKKKKKKKKLIQSSSSTTDPERTLREAGQIALSLAVSSAFAGGLGIVVAGSDAFLSLAPRWCKV